MLLQNNKDWDTNNAKQLLVFAIFGIHRINYRHIIAFLFLEHHS